MKKNLFVEFWRFNGILILILLLFCFSCQKEENTDLPSVKNDCVTFRDGRLIFKDLKSFHDHQDWIAENQSNPQLISDKNKSFGLKSMAEYYFEGMKLNEADSEFKEYVDKYPSVFLQQSYDNSTLYLLPHSILLCYIANKDGIYQVDNIVYRIVGKYLYCLNDESKIEMLFLPKDQISDEDIKVLYTRSTAKGDYSQASVLFSGHTERVVSSLIFTYNNDREYWDMTTHFQKKSLGVWVTAQYAVKSALGPGVISECTTGNLPPWSHETTGVSAVNLWTTNPFCRVDQSTSYAPAYSRGRKGSEYRYVYWADVFTFNTTHTYPVYLPNTPEPF